MEEPGMIPLWNKFARRSAPLAAAIALDSSFAAAAEPPPREPRAAEPPTTEPRAAEPAPTVQEPAPPVDPYRERIASYYAGFHGGIAPGVVFGNGKAGFAIALHLEYGFDTGTVIIAPGLSLGAYFLDPNVYIGMPTAKFVFPIEWFVPFIEGGAGVGQLTQPSTTGLALLGGGGFMIHASPNLALGVEAGYETIVGTDFGIITLGPIFALSF
jgi:hypothetical protein